MNLRSNAQSALEKAKKLEKKDMERGKRYVKVNGKMYVLVECDEEGNPTERGKEHIARHNVKMA